MESVSARGPPRLPVPVPPQPEHEPMVTVMSADILLSIVSMCPMAALARVALVCAAFADAVAERLSVQRVLKQRPGKPFAT